MRVNKFSLGLDIKPNYWWNKINLKWTMKILLNGVVLVFNLINYNSLFINLMDCIIVI